MNMKSVILAGGLGTRLREETEYRPKPMVPIGDMPIIWHIMKNLSQWNLNEFVIPLGYKGNMIKEYFYNYAKLGGNVTLEIAKDQLFRDGSEKSVEDWRIHLVETGALTMTGGRLFRLRDTLGKATFLCTYGDGLSNVNIRNLINFHNSHGKIATVTAAHPNSRFGSLSLGLDSEVVGFQEKPLDQSWVNAGFFIFDYRVFDYLTESSVLEKEPLENLVKDKEIFAFKHNGFWKPMDTLREVQELNEIWASGTAPWKNW